jgi:hypothetical protein
VYALLSTTFGDGVNLCYWKHIVFTKMSVMSVGMTKLIVDEESHRPL